MPKNNDLRYLIFLLLLTFLVSCFTSGCVTERASKTRVTMPPQCSIPKFAWDDRCKPWVPDTEPEEENFKEVSDEVNF